MLGCVVIAVGPLYPESESEGGGIVPDAVEQRCCRRLGRGVELAPQDILAKPVLAQRLGALTTPHMRAHHHPVGIFPAGIVAEQPQGMVERRRVVGVELLDCEAQIARLGRRQRAAAHSPMTSR